MRYFLFLFCFLVLCSNSLSSRPSFFNYWNSLKLGIGKSDVNAVPGTVLQAEYTRYIANALFASVKFIFSDADDDDPNARYVSQEMLTMSFNLKINPLVTHRHIISFSLGLTQNNYSGTGNYRNILQDGTTSYIPYSANSSGGGYSIGANYDFLFSRSCFLSVGGTAIKYNQTVYYVLISLGTAF